jgi:hypothetical protein
MTNAASHRRPLLLAGVVALCAVAAVAIVVATRPPTPVVTQACTFGVDGDTFTVTPEQAQNAAIIAAVAWRKGMPDHAVTVALAAALQESELRNLPYGDLDSLGLFQQRPSEGWGSPAQILDPDYAASVFYDHLATTAGWQDMSVTTAAQAVQHSAAPDAYAVWEPEARALASTLTGEVPAGFTCEMNTFGGAPPSPGALLLAARTEFGSKVLGAPLPAKQGWEVAAWAVAHAYEYHLRTVVFDGRTWRASSGAWTGAGLVTSSSSGGSAGTVVVSGS